MLISLGMYWKYRDILEENLKNEKVILNYSSHECASPYLENSSSKYLY